MSNPPEKDLATKDPAEKSWSIVQFEKSVGIVADNWFCKNRKTCYFPKSNAYTLNTLTETCAVPKKGWETHKVFKIYKENITDYEVAKVEYLQSENEEAEPPGPAPVKIKHTLPSFPKKMKGIESNNEDSRDENNFTSHAGSSISPSAENLDAVSDNISTQPQLSPESAANLAGAGGSKTTQELSSSKSATNLAKNDNIPVNNIPSVEEYETSQQAGSNPDKQLQILGILAAHHVLLQKILKAVTEQPAKVKSKTVDSAEEKDGSASDNDLLISNCPFKTPEDFKAFDDRLAASKTLRKQFRKELSLDLTKDRKTSCIALARKIFSDNVARCYTWHGRETSNQEMKKSAFCDTRMYNIISQTVNEYGFPDNKLTAKDYQDFLSDWFVQAKFRKSGKIKRKHASQVKALKKQQALEEAEKNAEGSSTSSQAGSDAGPSQKKQRKRRKKKSSGEQPKVAHDKNADNDNAITSDDEVVETVALTE